MIDTAACIHRVQEAGGQTEGTDTLKQIAATWSRWASVRRPSPIAAAYDLSRPDFVEDLLPFRDHPQFEAASYELRQQVLACGWLAYNEKTVDIESKVVSPACLHIIDGDLPRLDREQHRETAAQAQVDESYHILLIVNACRVAREARGLTHLRLPQFELIRRMHRLQDQHPQDWQRVLIQLACAIVSEIMVSDYLRLLSESDDLQPLNRLTTELHRRDESVHNAIFRSLGLEIHQSLSHSERRFFLEMLSRPAAWFASAELDVWESMLQQIGFPNAKRMIGDIRDAEQESCIDLDLTTFEALYESLEHRCAAEASLVYGGQP